MKPSRPLLASRKPARGGFTLGLIVGLLIGLAVALAVAMYVTKAPVPFVNKVPQRSADQDQAEAERNRNWDPNAPLAAKGSSRGNGAVGAPAPAADVTPAAVPAVVPASKPAPPKDKASAPKDKASAPKDKASAPKDKASAPKDKASAPKDKASAPATPASTASAPAKPTVWHVQAGAFSSNDEAEAQRARLAMLGMTARILTRDLGDGRQQFRVRMGPFSAREPADDVRDKLTAAGIESTLVKIEPR